MTQPDADLVPWTPSPPPPAIPDNLSREAVSYIFGNEVVKETAKRLGVKTPKKYRRTRDGPYDPRTGRKKKLTYAPHGYASLKLNEEFGSAWSFRVLEIKEFPLPPSKKGNERIELLVEGVLTTPFGEQWSCAGHEWYPDSGEQLRGDAVQAAASIALRRAASRLGIALDLYMGELDEATGENPVITQTRNVWSAALERHGITEANALTLLSEAIAGEADALTTYADIEMALETDVAGVTKRLDEIIDAAGVEPEPKVPKTRARGGTK